MLAGTTTRPKNTIASHKHLRKPRSEVVSRPGGALGNNRDFASRTQARANKRRYQLQRTARELLPDNKGLHMCMRRTAHGVAYPTIESNGERSRLVGVHRCKQGAVCPVCAPKIAMAHAKELAAATSAAYAKGWRVLHITYTLSHHKGESLEKVLSSIANARRKFLSGRGFQSIKLACGIEGAARSLEVTHGHVSGWHPHFHELLFVSGEPQTDLEHTLKTRWVEIVTKSGAFADYEHGLKLEEGHAAISEYLNKFGRLPMEGGHSVEMELSHGYSKKARKEGKTPFALLDSAYEGDDRDSALFVEYATAMRGKALIRWSKGLRKVLQLEDESTASEDDTEATFVEVASLSRAALIEISDNALLPAVLTAATAGYDVLTALLDCYAIIPHPGIPRLFIPERDIGSVYI